MRQLPRICETAQAQPGEVVVAPSEVFGSVSRAHFLADALVAFCHSDKDRDYHLVKAGDHLEAVAVAIGYVARPAKPFTGERAMQRTEVAIRDGMQKRMADLTCRAQERDHFERQAREALAERDRVYAECERLKAQLEAAGMMVAA